MIALSKEEREALAPEDFAAPTQRKLPIRNTPDDTRHTLMAWSALPGTRGLNDTERKAAKARILMRAHELGLDTSEWELQSLTFEMQAMAIAIPEADHPNKMPFTGILTRVNEASDEPPGGSTGKRVFIPATVAEAAIGTLLGMGVDCTEDFTGHNNRFKIGLITEANVRGNAVHIAGFLYASDFPEECSRIQQEKSRLGFSYECKVAISDKDADPWMIDRIVFTGAAILYKANAAYHTTSLAAKAEDDAMTPEELKKLNDSIAALTASVGAIAAAQKEQGEKLVKIEAGKGVSLAGPIIDQAMPHVGACNAAADGMEAAGIGTHPTHGHAAMLRKVGASILHGASMGKLPHIFRDHSYLGGDGVEASVDPALKAAQEKSAADLKAATDAIAALKTELADLKAKGFKEVAPPERKSATPEVTRLLSKLSLTAGEEGQVTVEAADKALEAAGIKGVQAMAAKLKMRSAGVLA